MQRQILLSFACLLLTPGAWAEQQSIEVHLIDAVDRERGVLNRFERSAISYIDETITIEEGGLRRNEVRKVPVERRTTHEWKLADHLVLDHEGRPVEKEEIWKRVKPGAVVFHVEQRSFTGSFLKTLAPGATVLLFKPKPPAEQPKP